MAKFMKGQFDVREDDLRELARRRAQANKMDRLNPVIRLCVERLGPGPARDFLNSPNHFLDGRRPLDVGLEEGGLNQLEAILDAARSARQYAQERDGV